MPENTTSNNTEPVTLDDLATMTARGFDEIKGEIKNVQNDLIIVKEELKKRPTLEQIDLKFQNCEKRLTENLGDKPMERDRVLNTKTDTIASKLGSKTIFSPDDVHDIEHISPFAVSPLNQ